MQLGIIGNCQYSALVDDHAKINWLCWPRFDSPSLFASLLDEEKGGFFSIEPENFSQSEQSYVRNTNVLRTVFTGSGDSFEVIDFAPRFHQHHRVFHPTSLVRIVRPLQGQPRIRVCCRPRHDYGRTEPRSYVGSNHIQYEGLPTTLRLTTNASLTYIQEEKVFSLSETKYFMLTWGQPLEASLPDTCETFLQYTVDHWRGWVKRCSVPSLYQDQVIRSALVLKLHQFEDTGAITAATTTSLPEFDQSGRNWDYRFCWFRDAYFSLSALRNLGQVEELESFVDYLRNIAESCPTEQRLQPLYSISGDGELTEEILEHLSGYRGNNRPVRVGNAAYTHIQNDIYGELILAIAPLFMDRRLVLDERKMPFPLLERLLLDIETRLEEKDAGLWEFRSIEQLHTFTVLMHWVGARTVQDIASSFQQHQLFQRAQAVEQKARKIIEEDCWNEQLSCYTQAAHGNNMDASLFMMYNFGFLHPKHPRAEQHLRAMQKTLMTSNGLVYRYVHADDFGVPETTFTVCSFWFVEALARMGHLQEAKEHFDRYLGWSNHLGFFSEDLHSQTLEQWGNFPQTYSHVGVINAAFQIARHEHFHAY